MLLTKLKLNYFGRFQNREIELKPGINLIYGDNEAGKSTIHTFIKGMLFGIERMRGRGAASKDDLYTRYLPWDYPGAFGGQMDIKVGEKEYRLQRSFHASDKGFAVIDLATGREVKLREGQISELVPGLSESTFKNTISIEQLKAQTDSELASQVRNYITNLSIAKSNEVNVAKAMSSLGDQRKALDTAQLETALKNLKTDIEEGLECEEVIDTLTINLRNLLAEEQELTSQRESLMASIDRDLNDRMEQLSAVIEKYRSYCELSRQSLTMDRQLTELKDKVSFLEKGGEISGSMREDLKEAEQIRAELPLYEKEMIELKKECEEEFRSSIRKNLLVSFIPTIVMAILAFLVIGSGVIKIILPAAALIVGAAFYLGSMNRCNRLKKEKLQQIDEIADKITALEKRLNNIFMKYQVNSTEELSHRKEETLKQAYTLEHTKEQLTELIGRKAEAEDKRDILHDTIMKYMQYFITEEELSDGAIERLQGVIRHKRQDISLKQEELNRRLEANRLQVEKLRWEISSMEGNEEQLLKNKESYEQLELKRKENALELEAINLALNTMKELSADIHDSFGRQLNQAVSDIIGEVTEKKYNDLKVDEKLDIKVGWNGDYILLDRLSAGTMDQVYFALRLAVADLLLGEDEMPLLLDDSFALYDENRVKAALNKVSDRKQILLFSCHRREQRILEEMKLPYHFVDLSCR